MFGGSIHRIRVNGGGTHYFNKIDGCYVDLTREQFDLYDIPIVYEPNEQMKRESLKYTIPATPFAFNKSPSESNCFIRFLIIVSLALSYI